MAHQRRRAVPAFVTSLVLHVLLVLSCALVVTGCARSEQEPVETVGEDLAAPTVVSIAITPASATIPVAVTQTFRATATLSNGATKQLTAGVWSSASTVVADVALVGGAGVANSKAVGSDLITITDPVSHKTASAQLTVTAATLTQMTVTPVAKSIPVATTQQMTAVGIFSDATKFTLLPPVVAWQSSNPTVASVSSSGLVTGVAPGVTTITARHVLGMSRTVTLEVGSVTLSAIQVSPVSADIPAGTTEPYTALGTYSDGTVIDITSMATWTSSKATVATLAGNVATGVANGASTITASFNAKKGTANLVVGPNTLKALAITPAVLSTPMGLTTDLTATGTYLDLSTRNISDTVTWSSTSTKVFTISNAVGSFGRVTPVAPGVAKAKAVDPVTKLSSTITVTVTPVALVSVTVSPAQRASPLGIPYQFTATGRYSDGTSRDLTSVVTWSAGLPTTTVSNVAASAGQATELAQGPDTITATEPTSGLFGQATFNGTPAQVVSMVISGPSSLPSGSTTPYQAIATLTDHTVQDYTTACRWISSNPAAATLGAQFHGAQPVVAVAPGSTLLKATISIPVLYPPFNGQATLPVTVTPAVVSDLAWDPAIQSTIAVGQQRATNAFFVYTDGTTAPASESVTWSTSDPAILAVSNVAGQRGQLTALAPGDVTISISSAAFGLDLSYGITVTQAVVTSVTISPSPISVAKGLMQQLTATAQFSDGTTSDVTQTVTWTTADGNIASVDGPGATTGLLHAIAAGATTVQATTADGLVQGTSNVTVTPATIVSLSVTGLSTIGLNEPATYKATATMTDGTKVDASASMTWSSTNDLVATVSNGVGHRGEVSPLAYGVTTLRALDPSSNATAAVNVKVMGIRPMVATGEGQTCALVRDGNVKCWGSISGVGDNVARGSTPGQLGANLPYVSLGTGAMTVQIAAGWRFACALLSDGRVKCWGEGAPVPGGSLGLAPGQMGNSAPAIDLGAGVAVTQIAAGFRHVCALLTDASVKCWGENGSGQLGLGDSISRTAPSQLGDNLPRVDLGVGRRAKRIFAGEVGSCAILDDDGVKCWGYNSFGQAGTGDHAARGGTPGTMGDQLVEIPLGAGARAIDVAISIETTCVVLADRTVKCLGGANAGMLGSGDLVPRDQLGQLGDNLPSVDLGDRYALEVTSGEWHTCARLDDGQVSCWGSGFLGTLGGSFPVTSDVASFLRGYPSWGDRPGQMGTALPRVRLGTGRSARAIASMTETDCAVLDDDSVKCWGDNSAGELGIGDTNTRGLADADMGDNLPAVDLTPCPFDTQNDPRNCRLPALVCASDVCTNGACAACNPPPAGLLSSWSGNDDALDSTGNRNGTLTGSVSYTPGEVADAFLFSPGAYVSAPSAGLPMGNADRTLEGWVRLDALTPNGEAFFAGYGAFGNGSQSFGLGASGAQLFVSQWGDGIGGPNLQLGVWTHVAVTTTNSLFILHVNGAEVGRKQLLLDTQPGDFIIGALPGDPLRKLTGAVDEVAIYDHALTAAELLSIYNAGPIGKCH